MDKGLFGDENSHLSIRGFLVTKNPTYGSGAIFYIYLRTRSSYGESSASKRTPFVLLAIFLFSLTPSLAELSKATLSKATQEAIAHGQRLTRHERAEVARAEQEKYWELRARGFDEVSNTLEAITLRKYSLLNKKQSRWMFRKRHASMADILFPNASPQEYPTNSSVIVQSEYFLQSDLITSRRNPIPYTYRDFFPNADDESAPFDDWRVKVDQGCTIAPYRNEPVTRMDARRLQWLRDRIQDQYRVHLYLDDLPLLMRSKIYNHAVRGHPIGFQAPPGLVLENEQLGGQFYLFNHLKFVVTYHQDPDSFDGVRITGFDVHPVSVVHSTPCNGLNSLENDPSTFLSLSLNDDEPLAVTYSYEVQWVESPLTWEDRWDVYVLDLPDTDLHPFSILCSSLLIVCFLVRVIGKTILRTLRKDSAKEVAAQSQADEERAGLTASIVGAMQPKDVFCPPKTMPLVLAVLVGVGAQLCLAFALTVLSALFYVFNPNERDGHFMSTAIFLAYVVLCGALAGYVAALLYKFMDPQACSSYASGPLLTSVTFLPSLLVAFFGWMDFWLSTAMTDVLSTIPLWFTASVPLICVGMGVCKGLKDPTIQVSTTASSVSPLVVPMAACSVVVRYSIPLGGLLPFAAVFVESSVLMSAFWNHMFFYNVGLVLVALVVLIVTCAQVSIVLTYLRLCMEDDRWWWPSFLQGACSGFYFFLFSLWFLYFRTYLAGDAVVIYLAYMGLISIFFGLLCGSIGFLSSFAFVHYFYGALNARDKATA